MTDDQRYEIATLACELVRAEVRLEDLAMMNVPIDPIQREKAAIEYHIAQTEFFEALEALTKAQKKVLNR